jgi:type III secretion system chaperone SycN
MAQFSSGALQAIAAFAASLGLPPEAAPDGSYNFVFARSGTLSLAPSDDGKRVLICLARVPYRSDVNLEKRFLDLAGMDPTTSTFVHAAMASDGNLVLAIDLEDGRFDRHSLDLALRRLIDLHDLVS